MPRYSISDELWLRMSQLLPGGSGRRGRPFDRARTIIEGILWRLRTGAPWRDVPGEFGPWSTVFSCFNRWSKTGIWEKLFESVKIDPDTEWHFVDATIVRVHQHGSGARTGVERAIGASRGGQTTKIHAMADGLGMPLRLILTGGQVHDSQPLEAVLGEDTPEVVIADKAYDAAWIRALIEERGAKPVIPQRVGAVALNPNYDRDILIENLFARLKQWRAVATRYEKTAANFLAVLHIASTMAWLA